MANEKRLIDANEALQKVDKAFARYAKQGGGVQLYADVRLAIIDAPTVDAVEVVHGRWKYYHKQNIAVCTNCSFERNLGANFGKAVSCPNCGAKMDGDGNA